MWTLQGLWRYTASGQCASTCLLLTNHPMPPCGRGHASLRASRSSSPPLPPLLCSLHGGSLAAVRFLPNSLVVAEAIFPRRTLLLDWQLTHEGSTSSVVATLPPEVSWTAVSQAVAYCESCGGFTGVLASAQVPQPGGASGSGGTVAFIFQNAQLAPAGTDPPQQPQAQAAAQVTAGASAAGAGASGRRLQQQSPAPPADCSLQVGDQTLQFERCQTVPMTPNMLYQCFSTLEPNSQGGTRWRGGLKIDAAAVGGQWAG